MCVIERARDVAGEPDCFIDWKLPLSMQSIAQRFAVDERHYIIELTICLARIE
jgi:hypothetical protein